jgi:hypothetical protein
MTAAHIRRVLAKSSPHSVTGSTDASIWQECRSHWIGRGVDHIIAGEMAWRHIDVESPEACPTPPAEILAGSRAWPSVAAVAARNSDAQRHAAMAAGKTEPETFDQAQTWQKVLSAYLGDELCHRCASQAAWGHQNGFSLARPPCGACVPIVAGFPKSAGRGSPWRRHQRGAWRPEPSGNGLDLAAEGDHRVPPSVNTPHATVPLESPLSPAA